jgi:hypothetical protein
VAERVNRKRAAAGRQSGAGAAQSADAGGAQVLRRHATQVFVLATLSTEIALIGWAFGQLPLTYWVPGSAPMNPLAMIAISLAIVAGWMIRNGRPKTLLRALLLYFSTLAIVLIGGLKLFDLAVGTHLCLDDVLFAARFPREVADSRMSGPEALTLLLLGLLILTTNTDWRRPRIFNAQLLFGLPALFTLLFALSRFLFRQIAGSGAGAGEGFSLPTMLSLYLLTLGVTMNAPTFGSMQFEGNATVKGYGIRAAGFYVPLLLGLLYAANVSLGWFSGSTAFALLVISTTLLMNALTVLHNVEIARYDAERDKLLQQLRTRAERDEESARLSESLIQTEDIVRTVASGQPSTIQALLAFIARQTGIPQFCVFRIAEETDTPQLEVLTAYAYGSQAQIERHVAFGEGLVGQCAVQNQRIVIDDIPDGYYRIRTASVELPPRQLMLLPLSINDELVGVLEAALLQPLSKAQSEYLERAVRIVSFAVYRLNQEQRVMTLLRELDRRGSAEQLAAAVDDGP